MSSLLMVHGALTGALLALLTLVIVLQATVRKLRPRRRERRVRDLPVSHERRAQVPDEAFAQ